MAKILSSETSNSDTGSRTPTSLESVFGTQSNKEGVHRTLDSSFKLHLSAYESSREKYSRVEVLGLYKTGRVKRYYIAHGFDKSRVSRFDSNLIVPTPSETVAKEEHTDKITADETPKTEPEREETPEPEPTPKKGYGLSMELVKFEDLNYDDEIFDIPEDQQEQIFGISEDQDKQTFGQELAKGNSSEVSEEEMTELESTPESRSRAQLQEWLDALKLAELEQKVLREEAEENKAADQGITEEIDPEDRDLVDIQNDKGDNEIAERAQVEVPRHPQASKIVEAPRRLNYIMLPEEVPQPVKGKNQKEIDNLFRRLLEEDSNEDDETEEEAEARLIAENNTQWERCLEYQRKYCEEYGSNGSDDDEPELPQDFRGNTTYKDDPSDDEELYDNRNSIWE
ncbi:hypothetical protein B0H16DRAFT_1452916 [Mycena metata]|uniref:Uncharacterized protein n=1 Tax=Mycena metata TaxID=1033252 RepID=A0AAD7JP52_9AGAR|nr:hypothetical protein B0H16DRAFT_1452916 [Mycena metata]